jgi:serine/threonine protein kinase
VPRAGAHPERIGPCRITRVLGQGGMGIVYEAEQLEPLRRTVALKVIRRGMDTDEVLARFESERQALAVMDHPNIARALDAGTTADGLPYFVMELVAGEPITDHCDRHDLDIRRRLELFVGVCRGVQHAHQKGVIHRDLKPSNILVRVTDGVPVPTILDFGIAKAVESRVGGDGFATALRVMVGTPVYMSPEQAEASGLDIDTRSDIYSLGMVLYELVTGMLPFDVKGQLPAHWITQYVLGDADIPTPSRRLNTLEEEAVTPVARHRHTTPLGLRRQLRGDLDWIVLKAIDRDRTRRYDTANALASDIERHLGNKPIVARPPTLGYTAAKFVRRCSNGWRGPDPKARRPPRAGTTSPDCIPTKGGSIQRSARATWRRPNPPVGPPSRCCAISDRSGTRGWSRSSTISRSLACTRGTTPRRSR